MVTDTGEAPGAATGAANFIRGHTRLAAAPLVPELRLHLADAVTPIWQASEAWLARRNVDPPFWAFAWPGGQALARHVLDHPERVAGLRVLDFASGCGIAALACAQAGAAHVLAADIDPLAVAAIGLNAAANGIAIEVTDADQVGAACTWDLILCGDVCYEAAMTGHILPWLHLMAAHAQVWVADPGRAYLPAGLAEFAAYTVPTTLDLEDRTERRAVLYRMATTSGC